MELRRRHRTCESGIAHVLALVLVAILATLAIVALVHAETDTSTSKGSRASPAQPSVAVGAVARRIGSAIVEIDATLARGGRSTGTGMVVTPSGQVLTNNHVIAGAVAIAVRTARSPDASCEGCRLRHRRRRCRSADRRRVGPFDDRRRPGGDLARRAAARRSRRNPGCEGCRPCTGPGRHGRRRRRPERHRRAPGCDRAGCPHATGRGRWARRRRTRRDRGHAHRGVGGPALPRRDRRRRLVRGAHRSRGSRSSVR